MHVSDASCVCAQAAVRETERSGLQLVWGKDDAWSPYMLAHQDAIRAKYYPSTVSKAA